MPRRHTKMEQIVKAVANGHRIAMLDLLNDSPGLTLMDISDELSLGVKTASAHLAKLDQAGLIDKKSVGRWVEHRPTKLGRKVMRFLRQLD